MIWIMLKHLFLNLKRFFAYSRHNREELQRDLVSNCIKDLSLNTFDKKKIHNILHIGAYYCLYDVKEYKIKENIPYAIKYSELVKKYVPNIDSEYPDNIDYIYEQFKKDILYSD